MKAACRIFSILATATLATATVLAVGGAQAAVLTTAGSTAYVDSGRGFKAVPPRTTVNPGDVISVEPGGRATLVYNNGCGFTVRPKRPVTVARVPPTCVGANSGPANTVLDTVIGSTVTATVFGTITYKASKMGDGPSSP